MGKVKKLTEAESRIAQIIYNELSYMYCDNCRFNKEITKDEAEKLYGYWGCEECHRKYNGWGVSKHTSESIARKICGIKEE